MAFGELAFTLDHLSVVDIVVKNGDAGKHPLYVPPFTSPCHNVVELLPHSHIHGHKFQIVNRADNYTSDDPTANPPLREGQANPMRRDTIQLLSMQSATLRFVADNRGAWLLHCHIDWHFSSVRSSFPLICTSLNDLSAPIAGNPRRLPVLATPSLIDSKCGLA